MNLVLLALMVMYFMLCHQRVLNHYGLTARDNNLMWIGCLIPSVLSSTFIFVVGAIGGTFLPISLIFILIGSYLVYRSYRSL